MQEAFRTWEGALQLASAEELAAVAFLILGLAQEFASGKEMNEPHVCAATMRAAFTPAVPCKDPNIYHKHRENNFQQRQTFIINCEFL